MSEGGGEDGGREREGGREGRSEERREWNGREGNGMEWKGREGKERIDSIFVRSYIHSFILLFSQL